MYTCTFINLTDSLVILITCFTCSYKDQNKGRIEQGMITNPWWIVCRRNKEPIEPELTQHQVIQNTSRTRIDVATTTNPRTRKMHNQMLPSMNHNQSPFFTVSIPFFSKVDSTKTRQPISVYILVFCVW